MAVAEKPMRFGDLAHRQAVVAFADEDVAGGVENLLPQQPLATPLASGHAHGQERNEEDERNDAGEAASPVHNAGGRSGR